MQYLHTAVSTQYLHSIYTQPGASAAKLTTNWMHLAPHTLCHHRMDGAFQIDISIYLSFSKILLYQYNISAVGVRMFLARVRGPKTMIILCLSARCTTLCLDLSSSIDASLFFAPSRTISYFGTQVFVIEYPLLNESDQYIPENP